MKGFPDLPPIWAAGIAVLAILIGRVFPLLAFGASRTSSFLLIALGFALILWSATFFFRKKTSIEPHHTPTALIVEGPYRVSRNPIYLGMFLGLIGVALWTGALSSLLVVAAFPAIINARFIRAEEDALQAQFSDEAEAYLASTARWFLI